jgi:outer membrane protein OmpA-like peptidoglycan-associated protein/tetratricopeptide (TPR) repeat protein
MNKRLYYLFFCFILAVTTSLPLQAQQKQLKEADALFNRFEYARAIPAYKKLLENQEPNRYVVQRIAEAYRLTGNTPEAEFWYNQVLSFPDYDPTVLKLAADVTRSNGKYVRAKQLYQQYGQRVPAQTTVANQLAAACDQAAQWLARPEPYELQKPEAINSPNSDFSPVFYQNGLVFTSDRGGKGGKNENVSGWTGKPFAQIYYAAKTSAGSYEAPAALASTINNKYQNGSATFTPAGQTIYFTRINQVSSKRKKADTDPFSWVKFADTEHVNRLEIYSAQKEGENWSKPKPFAYNKVKAYSVGHPALSPDGQMLYFVSDMPGGLGETDIYFCTKQAAGTWSAPVNAGNQVNTAGKELFPVVRADGLLYFASEGHAGMGGLDIFSATGSGATWQNVQNLKYPINSPADDFGIVFDETKEAGFLTSNRNSADGTDDIYAFKLTLIQCNLAGKTIERNIGPNGRFKEQPVSQVLVRLYQTSGDTTSVKTYSDAQGNFTFAIKDGQEYTIKATKAGYLTKSASITTDCQSVVDMVKLGMVMNRNTLNEPIILENIYYDFDKYAIRPDAATELDQLVRTLQDNPSIKIEISSHTDSRQTLAYNQKLSQLRAEAAVKYIISRGIDARRLTAKGYGETRPLNRCRDGVSCSELEHQINRRTEFKLLSR